MTHMRLWAAAAIIALVIVAGFILSVPHARDVARAPGLSTAAVGVPSVALHDTFRKGVHTITGSLQMPDACGTASAVASLASDATSTQRIVVAVTLSGADDVCLQLPTLVKFSTNVSAPAGLPLTATVNGSIATTTTL